MTCESPVTSIRKPLFAFRVLAALAFVPMASVYAQPAKIGAMRAAAVGTPGLWVMDLNGNYSWDETPTDGAYSWSTGQPGEVPVVGDWNGDGRTKMGVYYNGTWLLDYNGNGVWDPGVDILAYFGGPGYVPVVGDWHGLGKTTIGAYDANNGIFVIDYNGNFTWDGTSVDRLVYWSDGTHTNAPVIGDWNGDGKSKIGVFAGGMWLLDYDGNYGWSLPEDRLVIYTLNSLSETPVVGDWDASHKTKIGVYDKGVWALDVNGNFGFDLPADQFTYFGGTGFVPVVGDWGGTGTARIAAYSAGVWVIDFNGNYAWDSPPDVLTFFGGPGQIPVVGKWPEQLTSNSISPIGGNASSATFTAIFTDTGGVNDIDAVQIAFSTNSSGVSTNQACHVIYSNSQRLLLLESAAGDNTYPYSSNLGTGGQALSNGICVVDAAQTTVTTSNNVLTLVVPIVFTPSITTTFWAYTSLTSVTHSSNGWARFGAWFLQPLQAPPQCTGIADVIGRLIPPALGVVRVFGVQFATSVDFIIQSESQFRASTPAFAGRVETGGVWSYSVKSAGLAPGGYRVTARLNGNPTRYCEFPSFFVVIPATPPASLGPVPCNSLVGDWDDTIDNGQWHLLPGTSVTGTFRAFYHAAIDGSLCPLTTWQVVDGTISSGQFSISAAYPNPSSGFSTTGQPCPPTTFFTESGVLDTACSSARGVAVGNGTITSANFSWSRPPTVPDGETSSFLGWASAIGFETVAQFQGRLNSNSGLKFGGRSTTEDVAGSTVGAVDTCYFPGSVVSPFLMLSGGIWNVQNDDTYQIDYIGYTPEIVGYYQAFGPPKWGGDRTALSCQPSSATGCAVCLSQQMQISNQSGGFQNYGTPNSFKVTIDQTGVAAYRGSASANRTYSFK